VGAAIQAFLWTIVIAAPLSAIFVAGMYSPVLIILPVAAMANGLMLSKRDAWIVFAVILAGIVLVAWLHTSGNLPNGMNIRAPTFVALALAFFSAFGLLLGRETMESLQKHYGRAVALGAELTQANAELEARVAARTRELSEALERLKAMQEDLIQSEKLASLG